MRQKGKEKQALDHKHLTGLTVEERLYQHDEFFRETTKEYQLLTLRAAIAGLVLLLVFTII